MANLAIVDREGEVICLPRRTQAGKERRRDHELLTELVFRRVDAVVSEDLEPTDDDPVRMLERCGIDLGEFAACGR